MFHVEHLQQRADQHLSDRFHVKPNSWDKSPHPRTDSEANRRILGVVHYSAVLRETTDLPGRTHWSRHLN